jgi:hypothetical protein
MQGLRHETQLQLTAHLATVNGTENPLESIAETGVKLAISAYRGECLLSL